MADLDKRRIALTGATGALGGVLLRQLLDAGFAVNALFRKRPDAAARHPDLTPVIGDLSDQAALERLVAGADAVLHVAAMYRSEGTWEEFAEVNLRGTERLLPAAQAAGVRRFVYCSTIGVHGSVEKTPSDETAPFSPRDHYQESKLQAEKYCHSMVGQGTMEIVVLRPCGIYGPGDTRMLKLFRMLAKRSFLMVGEGKANFHPVYVDDLADAFVKAIDAPGIDGETFIIGGPRYLPLKDYIATAARTIGAPEPWIRLPYEPMHWAAAACEALFAPLRMQPPLHRRRLTFFKHNRAFSIEHARQKLGYDPKVDLEEGFRRTVEWYRQQGLLT
jgi:nucleoside-diphosphate-sugar epimerase